jgi:hypothetical protein
MYCLSQAISSSASNIGTGLLRLKTPLAVFALGYLTLCCSSCNLPCLQGQQLQQQQMQQQQQQQRQRQLCTMKTNG